MARKIAVQSGLSPLNEYLQSNGYEVTNWDNQSSSQKLDAIILTGMNDDVTGDQTIQNEATVILAEGRTPEQIVQELEQKTRKR